MVYSKSDNDFMTIQVDKITDIGNSWKVRVDGRDIFLTKDEEHVIPHPMSEYAVEAEYYLVYIKRWLVEKEGLEGYDIEEHPEVDRAGDVKYPWT